MQNYYSYPTSPIAYNQTISTSSSENSPSTYSYSDSINDSSYTYSNWPAINNYSNYNNSYFYSSPSAYSYYYKPTYNYENFSANSNYASNTASSTGNSYHDDSYGYPSSTYPISTYESTAINSTANSSNIIDPSFQRETYPEPKQDIIAPCYSSYTSDSIQTYEKQPVKKSRGIVKRSQLPDEAVDILNDWFDDHLNNPYPQMEEKERLAKMGNISVKQVNAWFSNRRNRSQNTKPKRIKRQMENKINGLFQLITDDSSKEQIMQKFRETLAN